jgi:branched-chain amino acid aminotransferase
MDEKDLRIDIYPFEFKRADEFSHLKSLPFFPYAEAARYAAEQGLDDCIVLNSYERIADSSISNIFILKNKTLYTPPLSEGCIEGVMRRSLLDQIKCTEAPIDIEDMLEADEVFLTNAIRGIRSVKYFRDTIYNSVVTEQLKKHILHAAH